jgi:hypothetical protein
MGRTYWFECSKCGYRAHVSGRPDRGLDLLVRTVACRECKALFDAVTRMRVAVDGRAGNGSKSLGWRPLKTPAPSTVAKAPPRFDGALNRLPAVGARRFKWLDFKLRCPVSPLHHVQDWKDPGRCPRCGVLMDKNAVPFRIWD